MRIVVSDMMAKNNRVGKRGATTVAQKMVAKYPDSLQDVIEGDVVGAGYHSLVKQILYRIENARRSDTPKLRKRSLTADSDTTDESMEARATIQDTYGCVKWSVKFLPLEETEESQEQKWERLKLLYEESGTNMDEVKDLMKCTYYTQRKHINEGKSVKWLREEWPFLFEILGMAVHYKELTANDLQGSFLRNLDLKGQRLLNFITTISVRRNKKLLEAYGRLQRARGPDSGCSDDVKEMILLLLTYFDEREETLFCYVEDTCPPEEVELENLPLTPAVIVCGK